MDRTKVRNPSGDTTRRVWHTRYRDLEVGPGDETVGLRTGRDITPPASIADAPARSGAATGMESFSPVLPLVSQIGLPSNADDGIPSGEIAL